MTAKLICYIASSLDGFIATPGGGVGWLDEFNADGIDYGYHEFYNSLSAIIVGATTYTQSVTFAKWPYPGKKVYVLTKHNLPIPKGADVELYDGDLSKLVKRLKEENDAPIWLIGGSKVLSSCLKLKLVDEMHIFQMPILLGKGIPLFSNLNRIQPLTLIKTKHFENGVVELRYQV